jgi:hypothetical protein
MNGFESNQSRMTPFSSPILRLNKTLFRLAKAKGVPEIPQNIS